MELQCVVNSVKIGSSFSIRIVRTSNERYIDLSGYSAKSSLYHNIYGEYPMKIRTETEVVAGDDVVSLVAYMEAEDTLEMKEGLYDWDIKMEGTENTIILPNDKIIQFKLEYPATRE